MIMLMRTDPFRELDRLTEQVLGTTTRPAVMPMDAWRDGDEFIVEFDLPGVKAQDVDLNVERNVLTVKAEYDAGVLRLTIPVSEQAKPHKIEIAHNGHRKAIKS